MEDLNENAFLAFELFQAPLPTKHANFRSYVLLCLRHRISFCVSSEVQRIESEHSNEWLRSLRRLHHSVRACEWMCIWRIARTRRTERHRRRTAFIKQSTSDDTLLSLLPDELLFLICDSAWPLTKTFG